MQHASFLLVGSAKGKIKEYKKEWLDLPWQQVRESVDVKLFEQAGGLYVLAKSEGKELKETAMRRKRLVRLLKKLRAMRRSLPSLVQLLMRLVPRKLKRAARSPGANGSTGGRPPGYSRDFPVSCG